MGGRGGSSGMSGGNLRSNISNKLSDNITFKIANFPSLEGSQKQIEWAEKIRQRVIKDLTHYAIGQQSDGNMPESHDILGKSKDEIIKDIQNNKRINNAKDAKAKEWAVNHVINRYKDISERIQRVNEVVAVKQASWWIDYSKNHETRFGQSGNYRNQQFKRFIDGKLKLKKGALPT